MAKDTKTDTPAPKVTMRDRRILERLRNPFGQPSGNIQWRDKGRVGRWFNKAIIEDKVWTAKNKGWNLSYPDDIEDLEQLGGFKKSTDGGHIVRGDRENEVLMWMYKDDYDAVQRAKAAHNTRNMGNPVAEQNEIVEAAGRQLGDEAAEFLKKRGGVSAQIVDTKERFHGRPEDV